MFGWLRQLLWPEVPADPVLEHIEQAEAASEPAPRHRHTGNIELDPVTGREIPKQSEN